MRLIRNSGSGHVLACTVDTARYISEISEESEVAKTMATGFHGCLECSNVIRYGNARTGVL